MDLKLLKAAAFVKRALESTDLKQKLLCIYDGFVCVFGPVDACKKAAEASGLDVSVLEKAIDLCMDSGEVYQLRGGTRFNAMKYINFCYRYQMLTGRNEESNYLGF